MTRCEDTIETRILVLAPIGRDAPAIAEVLKRAGLCSLILNLMVASFSRCGWTEYSTSARK